MGEIAFTWYERRPPATPKDLDTVESQLGVRLPEALRNLLLEHNGATPTPRLVLVPGYSATCVGAFLDFRVEAKDIAQVLRTLEAVADRLPPGVFPLADEPGGDLFCLDYRETAEPRVVYWVHERASPHYEYKELYPTKEDADANADGYCLVHLADSFEAFLGLLY